MLPRGSLWWHLAHKRGVLGPVTSRAACSSHPMTGHPLTLLPNIYTASFAPERSDEPSPWATVSLTHLIQATAFHPHNSTGT